MKRLICVLLSTMLVLSSLVAVAAGTTDLTSLVEEALTSEVKTGITEDLVLPESWNDASITWSSSDDSVINAETGVVTRGASDKTVTLTATAEDSTSKDLTFKVLGLGTKVWYNENFNSATVDTSYVVGANLAANIVANPENNSDKSLNFVSTANISGFPNVTKTFTDTAAGKVTFKTKLKFDGADFSSPDGYLSHRQINFYADSNANPCATLKFFSVSDKNAMRMTDAGTEGAGISGLVSNGYVTVNGNATSWFDLEVVFDFVNGNYTATITNGTKTASATKKLANSTTTSALTKFNVGYRAPSSGDSVGLGTYLDDMLVTTAEIAGETDNEKLAVYQSMLEAEFMKGQDKRFVTTDIDLTNVPEFDGFTVDWQSSNENVLVIDGDVAKPKFSEIAKPVKLIATISYGTATPVTSEFELTVHPVGTSAVNWGEDKILDFETCTVGTAPANTYAGGKLSGVTSIVADANKGKVAQSNTLVKYGVGSWGSQISYAGVMTTSLDLKYDKPANFTGRELNPSVTMNLGTKISAQVGFRYAFEEGNEIPYKTLYLYTAGGYTTYSGELPELGEWFNLKIMINSISKTYDIYIDDVLITQNAVPFVNSDAPGYLYNIAFKANDAGVATPVVQNFDNICITTAGTSNSWVNTVAALASANASNLSNLVTTGGITWSLEPTTYASLTGDSVKSVKVVEGIGKKTAVLTATATDATVGQIARVYNIEFSLDEPVKIDAINYAGEATEPAAGVTVTSITTNTERDGAQGYLAIYDGDKLSEVKKFAITKGTGVENELNYTIPSVKEELTMKIFVWTNELVPLASVWEK